MPVATQVVNGAVTITKFRPSPPMPSYLVELTAGDWARSQPQRRRWARHLAARGREQDGKTALANAKQILADYDDYFGYRYPLPKLDSIAVPGGFGGAMENWGAITYNDQLLLLSETSTVADHRRCSASRRTKWRISGMAIW